MTARPPEPQHPPGTETARPAGGSFLNLLASLESGLGCREALNPEPELPELPSAVIAAHRHVVVWLVDGFANVYLGQAPTLRADRIATIRSTFPSTTACAITSLLTGLPPAQHGLLGWHTFLPGPQRTLTVLLARETGKDGRRHALDARRLGERIRLPPLASRLHRSTTFFTPASIAHSPYNRALRGRARVVAYHRLEEIPLKVGEHVHATSRVADPQYTYVYWSHLDHLGHEHGPGSAEVAAHLAEIDTAYLRLCAALDGSGALLVTTTDHGMRPVSRRLDLRDGPGVRDCLERPLSGEARAAIAHVRPGRHRRFREAMAEAFGNSVDVLRAEEWLSDPAQGTGVPHPELAARAGDYLLLPDGESYLCDPRGDDAPPEFLGAHGGRTPEETMIPLLARSFVARASPLPPQRPATEPASGRNTPRTGQSG